MAILKKMGQDLARHRLNLNLTQETLAREAGISKPTLQRIEAGHSTQTSNLVRVLRALKLLAALDTLIPEPGLSPLQLVKLQGKQRRRASSQKPEKDRAEPWTWGADT